MKFAYQMDRLLPVDEEAGNFCARLNYGDTFEMKLVRGTRTMSQNSLYQVFARELGEFIFQREITEAEHEATKIDLQRRCYLDTGWPFLVRKLPAPITGKSKLERMPTSAMDKGDLHQLLNWVQQFAAERGLILEAKGEFQELRERQAA